MKDIKEVFAESCNLLNIFKNRPEIHFLEENNTLRVWQDDNGKRRLILHSGGNREQLWESFISGLILNSIQNAEFFDIKK
jgi:hypothetical protein